MHDAKLDRRLRIHRLDGQRKTGKPVTHFETIHEKLFHLFLVSQDLEYFSHEHPTLQASGWFRLKTRLPKPGAYRLLADFDPTGGTPQLSARTFSTAGWETPPSQSIRIPAIDIAPKQGANLTVTLRIDPPVPPANQFSKSWGLITVTQPPMSE